MWLQRTWAPRLVGVAETSPPGWCLLWFSLKPGHLRASHLSDLRAHRERTCWHLSVPSARFHYATSGVTASHDHPSSCYWDPEDTRLWGASAPGPSPSCGQRPIWAKAKRMNKVRRTLECWARKRMAAGDPNLRVL